MENYHLFVVDSVSFKYHLEYLFVGTGNTKEFFNVGLWEDASRLKIGDKVLFYVQGIKMFYGIFEISSKPFFDEKNPPYLQQDGFLNIKKDKKNIFLKNRALIKPYKVFENGLSEFDLIDVLPEKTKDVLWSIIYRKLKGLRGNSPIFKNEFEIISQRFTNNNHSFQIDGNFTFENLKINRTEQYSRYDDEIINEPICYKRIIDGHFLEPDLHALLLECLPDIIFNQVDWIGNEVYSGAGTQAIDILASKNHIDGEEFLIIELKKGDINHGVTLQLEKYIKWLKGRFSINNALNFQPILFGGKLTLRKRKNRITEILRFNQLNISKPIKCFEYSINDQNFLIEEIDYSNNEIINQHIINEQSF